MVFRVIESASTDILLSFHLLDTSLDLRELGCVLGLNLCFGFLELSNLVVVTGKLFVIERGRHCASLVC